jgi:Protein of unknown function (DUF3105)
MNKDGKARPAARRRSRARTGATLAGAMLVVAVVGYFAYRASADLPGIRFPDQGNLHIATPGEPHEAYNSDPPTSGPHLPYIAPWGIYTRPIERELQVHNLEDAGVLVQYNCTCPELVERLATLVRRFPTQVILAPYPTMKSRIALTAWTRLDTLDDFDARRITRFIEAYRGIDHHK